MGHSSKTQKNNDTAPAEISKPAGGNPIQPRLREYPKNSEGKSNASSFVNVWFDKYQRGEYSQERDATFCFACRHFAYGNANDTFTKTGFRQW